MSNRESELRDIEMKLLLEGIYRLYGYDFRDYAPSSLSRRIRHRMEQEKLDTISELQERVLRDPQCMERFLLDLSINTTAMFRDPGFWLAFRKQAVPLLAGAPAVRLWHAGCSTGEEVYSTAIVLLEEGLYDKTRIYATDMNEAVLARAKARVFPLQGMQEFTEDYQKSGGRAEFSEYYSAGEGGIILKSSLQKNVCWAQHNLVTDSSFQEFHAVFCRNVMIYFNKDLQARVIRLLYESLTPDGLLCLGAKESLASSAFNDRFEVLASAEKIYRRVK